MAWDMPEPGISAVLGNGTSSKLQCLNLNVPALDPPELLLPILLVPSSPGNTFCSHSEKVPAGAGPVCLAWQEPVWDQVRHCLGLHSSGLSSREDEEPEAKCQLWQAAAPCPLPATLGLAAIVPSSPSLSCCPSCRAGRRGWEPAPTSPCLLAVDVFVAAAKAPANPGFCQPC